MNYSGSKEATKTGVGPFEMLFKHSLGILNIKVESRVEQVLRRPNL